MPRQRKQQEYHLFTVYINSYASAEVKRAVESGELRFTEREQLGSSQEYFGASEREAAWNFYKAIRIATAKPLAYSVTMYRDSEVVVRAPVLHSL